MGLFFNTGASWGDDHLNEINVESAKRNERKERGEIDSFCPERSPYKKSKSLPYIKETTERSLP